MAIPQRALNLSLAAMRRLNSAWGRLTTLRKVIVVGIAVMTAVAALKNGFEVFTILLLPCAMLLFLIWGLSQLFGLLGLNKLSENTRVALAIAVVVGFPLFCAFMTMPGPRVFRHAELNAEMQEVRIERNKVRIGMTINDVLPLVHGMDIGARAVIPDNLHEKWAWDHLDLVQRDGTFWCECEADYTDLVEDVDDAVLHGVLARGEKGLRLTESQAAELMKQKMSDGYEWCWQYTSPFKGSRQYFFNVAFGRDGRVNHISDVYYDDLEYHRP